MPSLLPAGSIGRIQPTAAIAIAAAAASQPAALRTALEPDCRLPDDGSGGILTSRSSWAKVAPDSGEILPATGLASVERFQAP